MKLRRLQIVWGFLSSDFCESEELEESSVDLPDLSGKASTRLFLGLPGFCRARKDCF
jgi:hypothetical protein